MHANTKNTQIYEHTHTFIPAHIYMPWHTVHLPAYLYAHFYTYLHTHTVCMHACALQAELALLENDTTVIDAIVQHLASKNDKARQVISIIHVMHS